MATGDYITVHEIANLVVSEMGLGDVKYNFSGGDRGWKGDVPIIRFELKKILSLGWHPKYSSYEAIKQSIKLMLQE